MFDIFDSFYLLRSRVALPSALLINTSYWRIVVSLLEIHGQNISFNSNVYNSYLLRLISIHIMHYHILVIIYNQFWPNPHSFFMAGCDSIVQFIVILGSHNIFKYIDRLM